MNQWKTPLRLSIVISALFGLVLNLIQANNVLEMLSYYTIQSNVLVAVFFGILCWFDWKKQPWDDAWSRVLTGIFTIGITITMLVFHVLIAPTIASGGEYVVGSLRDSMVHTVTPMLTLMHWFLFSPKGSMKATDPLFYLIQPIDYVVYLVIYTSLGGRFTWGGVQSMYPYFFLNLEFYGVLGVLQFSAIILLLYLVLGYLLYFLDGVWKFWELRKRGNTE
jgi:hypothetical protein